MEKGDKVHMVYPLFSSLVGKLKDECQTVGFMLSKVDTMKLLFRSINSGPLSGWNHESIAESIVNDMRPTLQNLNKRCLTCDTISDADYNSFDTLMKQTQGKMVERNQGEFAGSSKF